MQKMAHSLAPIIALLLATMSGCVSVTFEEHTGTENNVEIRLETPAAAQPFTAMPTLSPTSVGSSPAATSLSPSNSPRSTATPTATESPLLGNGPTQVPVAPEVIATAIASNPDLQLMHMDFEQSGNSTGNTSGGDWTVREVSANRLLEVHSPATGGPGRLPSIDFGNEQWDNYLFAYRFKITDCNSADFFGCMIVTTFRNEAGQCYVLLINVQSGEVSLQFGGRNGWVGINHGLTDTFLSLGTESWHRVLLAADGDLISASVDGKWSIKLSDFRLKTGVVGIAVGAGTTAQFDDFAAWSIPASEPSTATPGQSSLLLFSTPSLVDDFNNPTFDGMIDRSKWTVSQDYPGACKVVQENGSLAITHSPSSGLKGCQLHGSFANATGSQSQSFQAKMRVSYDFKGTGWGFLSLTLVPEVPDGASSGGWIGCALDTAPGQVIAIFEITSGGRNEVKFHLDTAIASWHTLRLEISQAGSQASCFVDDKLVGSATPKNLGVWRQGVYERYISAGWPAESTGTYGLDDVAITP